jgi:excisionase family DNA binding protein
MTIPVHPSPLLSTFEAAVYLGVPRQTLAVWRSRDTRRGPAYVNVGRHIKYRRGDLDAWIDSQRVDPGER